jgi:UPF0271 protein
VLTIDAHPPFSIDLNCDMGEGMPTDPLIYPMISSANIACGGHAGDIDTMRRSVELALQHDVAIGAHPSYPDKAGFGRSDILESRPGSADKPYPFNVLFDHLASQIAALISVCKEFGARLHHVKPHGALYNRAAKDPAVSKIICESISATDRSIIIYGLSGSLTSGIATTAGLRFVHEVFADRTYRSDGSLTPRSEPFSLIHDPATMLNQVLTMVRHGQVRTITGLPIPIAAESICLHGDGEDAVKFASIIRSALRQHEIAVHAP